MIDKFMDWFFLDVMMRIPKTVIDWLNIDGDKVFLLTYLAFGLIILEILYEKFIAKPIRNEKYAMYASEMVAKTVEASHGIARGLLAPILKYLPTFAVFLTCDPFVQRIVLGELAEEVALNDSEAQGMLQSLLGLIGGMFACAIIFLLLVWFIRLGISLLKNGVSKTFRYQVYYFVSIGLPSTVIFIVNFLNILVLYCNYCM